MNSSTFTTSFTTLNTTEVGRKEALEVRVTKVLRRREKGKEK